MHVNTASLHYITDREIDSNANLTIISYFLFYSMAAVYLKPFATKCPTELSRDSLASEHVIVDVVTQSLASIVGAFSRVRAYSARVTERLTTTVAEVWAKFGAKNDTVENVINCLKFLVCWCTNDS